MASLFSTSYRLSLGLLLGCLIGGTPMNAQLDPRLQSGKTDFMNLYQQATSTNAKPEIVTVFDYSGSMSSLMNHPLYRNDDKADQDAYRSMRFVLTNGGTSPVVAPNNRYRIRAQAANCSGAYAEYTVTVGATGATGIVGANPIGCTSAVNTAPTYTIRASAAGNTNAYATVTFTPAASGANPNYNLTGNANNGTRSNILGSFTITHQNGNQNPAPTIELSATSGGTGTVITMTAYLTHPLPPVQEPPLVDNTGITWSGATLSPAVWSQVSVGLYKSVTTWTVPAFTPTTADPTQLRPITVNPGTPFSTPGTLTFNTYFITRGTGANNDRINWSVSQVDTSNQSCAPVWSTITPSNNTGNTTSFQASKNVTWTIPAYQDPTTCSTGGVASGSYVTVTLDPRAGSSPVPGVTYLTSSLSARTDAAVGYEALRKPDGTAVTQGDADARNATSGLRGAGVTPGSLDVRNWIRAASHVRFRSGTRTIDIPIPWKITNRNSAWTNPLTSQTVLDQQIKNITDINGNVVPTTYGSGLQIELDQNFKLEAQNGGTFASGDFATTNGPALATTAQTTAYLYTVAYRPAYVSWLFNGKYQNTSVTSANYTTDSSLIGKYIVFDAASTTGVAGQTNVSWGQGYGPTGLWGNIQVPRYNLDGTYKDSISTEASAYKIPALTRMQAVKGAAIQTWIGHQADVFWAFRCLDPITENGGSSGDATTINNDSSTTISASDATTTHVNGNDTGWKVLNNTAVQGITSTSGNSVAGMNRIASLFANGGTPLTYAMARGLAQYGDPGSVFNSVVGTDVSQCVNHFLILFTDGLDNNGTSTNNGNSATPYITGAGTPADPLRLNALAGNQSILANKTNLDRSGSYWNMFSFAGVAAHLADASINGPTSGAGTDYMAAPDPGSSSVTGVPSSFLPFAIKKRNGVTYDKDHRVTTMTVGVSLGGQYTDTASPKRSLYLTAVVGDQATRSGKLDDFHSFFGWEQPQGDPIDPNNDWIPDPQDPTSYPTVGKKKDGAVYFFDATDPDKLSKGLDFAFRLAIGTGGNNTTASPNLPFVGASLGKQVYIGNFQPPKSGGVVWPGDLFMFGTRESGGTISIIDNKGDVASIIDKSTAFWAASDALLARNWKDRTLYTRLPNGTVLSSFKDTGADFTTLKPYVATAKTATWSDAQFQEVIQNAAGGNILGSKDVDGRPVGNRTNLMGDIINSAPAALEYNFKDSTIIAGIAAHPRLSAVAGDRFRIILVGTNQGWLHAFGEVTKTSTITDSNGKAQEIVTGAVDELWSFMPTDFLKDLEYVYGPSSGTNSHRFMVDGTPSIYLLDLPQYTGGGGNGWLDYNADITKSERGIAIIGLRKGGRSYYALDIRNPFDPKLKWSLVPDESAALPTTRNITSPAVPDTDLQTLVGNMGFSSSTPGIGRIAFNGKLRDAVFLGGGFSNTDIEANFLKDGKTIPLGRSVMAMDVYTGDILSAADLTKAPYATTVPGNPTTCTVGPIAAGLVPFEYFLNSGMAQRAYFLDYFGGLWSWGSKATPVSTDPTFTDFEDYRVDSSDLAKWTAGASGSAPGIRKVYHEGIPSKNWLYSTLPAPFRVGYFRGVGKDGKAAPSAVGVAMVSGDRNNPVDYEYTAGNKPSQHRLTVVFDRQDSRAWGLDTQNGPDTGIADSQLADFTAKTATTFTTTPCSDTVMKDITPGCNAYYLAPKQAAGSPDEANTKFGYYVHFPAATNTAFVSKGINTPSVIAGSLFYTYFEPTEANPCTGGTGISHSMLIADVFNPLIQDDRTGIANPSGELARFTGVSSDYVAVGTRGVIQGGTVALANPIPGGVQTTIEIKNLQGQSKERYPKARVWRTVQ